MKNDFLDHKLECKSCGTIYLNIPRYAGEQTPIHCSTCNGYLGKWGELQNDFLVQIAGTDGVFELDKGRIWEK